MILDISVGDIVNVTIGTATLDSQEIKSIPGENEVYWTLEDTVNGVITIVGPSLTTLTKL